jgi:hypothetical protein
MAQLHSADLHWPDTPVSAGVTVRLGQAALPSSLFSSISPPDFALELGVFARHAASISWLSSTTRTLRPSRLSKIAVRTADPLSYKPRRNVAGHFSSQARSDHFLANGIQVCSISPKSTLCICWRIFGRLHCNSPQKEAICFVRPLPPWSGWTE